MEYLLISSTDSEELSRLVNEQLDKGFELYGSPDISTREIFTCFCQAVKKEKLKIKTKGQKKYLLLVSNDSGNLSKKVNTYLDKGWVLYCSPGVAIRTGYIRFCQAIICDK